MAKGSGNNNIFVKIMAGFLAFLMVGSMCFTVVAWLISSFKK